MSEQLIPFLTASVLLTISPGPDIIYVLVQSITNGKRAGIITSLGLISGIIIHTSLVAVGISALIKESETLFILIKVFGALYLFYLAFKVWRSSAKISLQTSSTFKNTNSSLFKRGFVMNVLNPKVTIFFLAFFPGFLWEPSGNTIFQFYILGFLFMLQAFLVFGVVSILAGKINDFLHWYKSSGVVLKWIQIVVFIGIGILILM